jgi:glycosyltransferase involved in cell wall biosynthesis
MSMAGSFLATEPCEMLFKAGADDILGWDAELQDRSILRCWLGFTQGPGTVYYRMSGYADKMQKLGAEVHYNPYNEEDQNSTADWAQKVRYSPSEKRFINGHIVNQLEQLLKASDMSIFQVTSSRDVLLFLTTARLGVIKKPMYTELDDWIFDIPSYNFASTPYHPNSESEAVAYDQLKLSDGFIVSTNYLKEKLEQLCPGKPCYVVKNSIDFDIWDKVERPTLLHDAKPDLVRIGYTGCSNHSGDLEIIKKPLMALLEEFPNLEFVTLPFETFKDIQHERIHKLTKWTPLSQFPHEVSSWELDFGIAPLRDNELNRAKSNLRWLEYSALHLPTVASRVYPFQNSILDNKDGLLVSNNAKDWYEAMRGLIVEKGKRTRIGEAAYKRVKKEYSMDQVAKTYLSILKSIKNEFLKEDASKSSLAR